MSEAKDSSDTTDAAKVAAEVAARYWQQAHQWRFDPLHNGTQFLLVCILLALTLILCCYWRTFLNWVSEDNVLRCDRFCLQYWIFFQCCGICDGEWTRCLSYACCWCFPSIRGRNLNRTLGEFVGISPVPIRVQNITLGSLPQSSDDWLFSRSPDIYLSIFPDEMQPIMSTEVIQQANVDCVQFTTALTLAIKNNINEDPVRFVVRELRLAGTRDVADCFICPARLIAWAKQNKKVRVQLTSLRGYKDPLHTAWMLLDLSFPPEVPYLRTTVGSFKPIVTQTSASVEEGLSSTHHHRSVKALAQEVGSPRASDLRTGVMCGTCSPRATSRKLVILPSQASTAYKKYTRFDDFREDFPLVNEQGIKVQSEEHTIGRELWQVRGYIQVSGCFLLMITLVYLGGHFVTTTCCEEYRQLKVMWRYAQKENKPFPLHPVDYDRIKEDCDMYKSDIGKWASNALRHKLFSRLARTEMGLRGGRRELKSICTPDLGSTIRFCNDFPDNATHPLLFETMTCLPIACSADANLQEWDLCLVLAFLLWTICVFIAFRCVQCHMRQELEVPSTENISKYILELMPSREGDDSVSSRASSRASSSRANETRTLLHSDGSP